jgi:Holliday junction resolvasome RuvABC endonuclease subunit
MLMMPSGASRIARIIGIDPGTNTFGVAELSFDVVSLEVVNVTAATLVAAKHTKDFWSNEIHGDRFSRLSWLGEQLLEIFHVSDPFRVAIESPFFSRLHPNAFEPLVETKCLARRTLARFTAWKSLHEYDPPSVKNAVGGKGNADKNKMKELVCGLNLPYSGNCSINELDEHSIDAIAVAICAFQDMLEELCLKQQQF